MSRVRAVDFRYAPIYWGSMGLLLVLLVFAGALLIGQQRENLLNEALRHSQGELTLIGLLVRESLRKHDYQTAEKFLTGWGREHEDVVEIKARARNGFVLGHYQRSAPTNHPFAAKKSLEYSYTGLLELKLVKDLGLLHKEIWKLFFQMVFGAVLLMFVIGQFLWIAQRKQIEKSNRFHQNQLAHVARLSTMGEMVSGIAHEINQPLASMVTYAQTGQRLLDANALEKDELRHVLQQIAAQGLRVGEIISRLKNFTRKGELKRRPVDVNNLVNHAVEMVKAEAKERGVYIRLKLADNLPMVVSDAIQVEQIILNLVRNGMEAMEQSGSALRLLTVTTTENDAETVKVTISDTGPGVAEEALDKIFEPFFTTKSNGMGMGLAISRTLIEAHGGHLWLDTDQPRGTRFHFTLPSIKAATAD